MKLSHIQSVIDLKLGEADTKKKISLANHLPINQNQTITPIEVKPQIIVEATTLEPIVVAKVIDETVKSTFLKPIGSSSGMTKLEKLRQQVTSPTSPIENTEAIIEVVIETTVLDSEFSEEQLKHVWNLYIEKLVESGKKSLVSIYKVVAIKLIANSTIELILSSQHEKEMIDEDRINITQFLRSNLNNRALDLTFTVNSTITPFKAFTAEDKFKLMSEKNPELLALRQTFGLELE
jgi:DNA polymerase-3 subunit gamma/tau